MRVSQSGTPTLVCMYVSACKILLGIIPDYSLSQTIAERLYRHIDNLELHVGMQAEESKPAIPGSGLCPSYTVSRAILADAVALVRGDRFLTSEFTGNAF